MLRYEDSMRRKKRHAYFQINIACEIKADVLTCKRCDSLRNKADVQPNMLREEQKRDVKSGEANLFMFTYKAKESQLG
jgi:hypothetical protein